VRYWQICPIGPTGYGDSPYQTFSGRAGNPYFVDLDELVDAGLLKEKPTWPRCAACPRRASTTAALRAVLAGARAAHDRFAASHGDELEGIGSSRRVPKAEFRVA
jgi:4-alpha-glucanotransferase